jgi:Family of unknown function (DUF5331)
VHGGSPIQKKGSFVNTQRFRQSIKARWLDYYIQNRHWIICLRVWVNCDGQRRPSSSFILAALSALEPDLNQMLPLIVDLSSNPDRIVAALGLNFNPDDHPDVVQHFQTDHIQEQQNQELAAVEDSINRSIKMLSGSSEINLPPLAPKQVAQMDEACTGEEFDLRRSPKYS